MSTNIRLHRQLLLLLAIALLLPSCGFRHGMRSKAPGTPKHSACVSCHRMEEPSSAGPGRGLFPAGADPADFCRDCHHDTGNHHPVDVTPTAITSKGTMSAFPLREGKITCLTCHVAHTDESLAEPRKLLRGGPYRDRREICFRCHYAESYAAIDPHKMLDARGEIREVEGKPVCLFCHREQPRRDSAPDTVTFQADIAFLCWRCHPPMPGDFLQKHFQRKPKERTQRIMERTEYERGIALPLTVEGAVSCSTCHNPHQAGVLWSRSAKAGEDAPGRLRLDKGRVCSACHDMK